MPRKWLIRRSTQVWGLLPLYVWSSKSIEMDADISSFSLDTGETVFLPFRMSCYVLTNLVVTAGMLTPGLQV